MGRWVNKWVGGSLKKKGKNWESEKKVSEEKKEIKMCRKKQGRK